MILPFYKLLPRFTTRFIYISIAGVIFTIATLFTRPMPLAERAIHKQGLPAAWLLTWWLSISSGCIPRRLRRKMSL
jgi:hypothetical protein